MITFENNRFFNPSSILEYIKGDFSRQEEIISEDEAQFEELMLSLRTDLGVRFNSLPSSFLEDNQTLMEQYQKKGLLLVTKEGMRLTEQGFFVSNSVISSFRLD